MPAPWLLLLHHVPPTPGYLRVKVWRRLQRIGAVAVKNAAYVLPNGEQAREDFEWLLREITDGGGEAVLGEVTFVEGISDERIRELFREAREADYGELVEKAGELSRELAGRSDPFEAAAEARPRAVRLRSRLTEIVGIDHFAASGRTRAEEVVRELERLTAPADAPGRMGESGEYRGRTWVTRQNVFMDRVASAWLIRRFIDPAARFRFVAEGYQPADGELRFDMYDAEFTHEGDRCTFEVLLQRLGPDDPALVGIAEVVHDIDLKDGKFARPEAPGIERLIEGLCAAVESDEARVSATATVFDGLYEAFGRR
jgi:hypothetical protein